MIDLKKLFWMDYKIIQAEQRLVMRSSPPLTFKKLKLIEKNCICDDTTLLEGPAVVAGWLIQITV